MKMVATIARYLLGAVLLVFGLNAFFQFMPAPEYEGDAAQFLGLLFTSGWFTWIAVVKILSGLMLLAGRFVPLGLTLIGGVLVNILIFHLVYDLAGIGMGLALTVMWFLVFLQYKESFRGIFAATPN